MAIVALLSAKGSPGVTTTALACALSWRRRLVLAECDPAGGSILAGYLGGALEGPRGLGELAVAELRDGRLERDFWAQLVDLDAPKRERLLLPGLVDAAQAGSVTPLWQRIADFFADLDRGDPAYDVIVDCGRLHVAAPAVADAARRRRRRARHRRAPARPVQRARRTAGRSNATSSSTGCRPARCGCWWSATATGAPRSAKALRLPVIGHLPDDPRTADVLESWRHRPGWTRRSCARPAPSRCRSGRSSTGGGPASAGPTAEVGHAV